MAAKIGLETVNVQLMRLLEYLGLEKTTESPHINMQKKVVQKFPPKSLAVFRKDSTPEPLQPARSTQPTVISLRVKSVDSLFTTKKYPHIITQQTIITLKFIIPVTSVIQEHPIIRIIGH